MTAIRALFLLMSTVVLIGIWLSGFAQVHWFLYVAPVMLTFAGVTGICPGLIVFKKLGLK
jgi:hypothetical protein